MLGNEVEIVNVIDNMYIKLFKKEYIQLQSKPNVQGNILTDLPQPYILHGNKQTVSPSQHLPASILAHDTSRHYPPRRSHVTQTEKTTHLLTAVEIFAIPSLGNY